MNAIDLNLKLILGLPISAGGINIHSVKIKEIAEFGYFKYNQALKILCIDKFEIKEVLGTNKNISSFEFLVFSMINDYQIKALMEEILYLICKEKIIFSQDDFIFKVGKSEINSTNFEEIVSIVRKRNCIKSEELSEGNPSNDKAKRILEKRKMARIKIKNRNKENNSNLDISDIISSLSLKTPIKELMNLDIYQLIDKFSRLIKYENYHTNINALIHGANKNELDLKHWA